MQWPGHLQGPWEQSVSSKSCQNFIHWWAARLVARVGECPGWSSGGRRQILLAQAKHIVPGSWEVGHCLLFSLSVGFWIPGTQCYKQLPTAYPAKPASGGNLSGTCSWLWGPWPLAKPHTLDSVGTSALLALAKKDICFSMWDVGWSRAWCVIFNHWSNYASIIY